MSEFDFTNKSLQDFESLSIFQQEGKLLKLSLRNSRGHLGGNLGVGKARSGG